MRNQIMITTLVRNETTCSPTTARWGSAMLAPHGKTKPEAWRYGTCQPPRNRAVVMPAITTVSRKSAMANMPNFMPLDEVADDLRLAFRGVEGNALGRGDARGEEQDERGRLRQQAPRRDPVAEELRQQRLALPARDVLHVERAVDHDHAHDGG